jgi:polar amino acid transport system substrate-binding protein
MTKVLLGWLVVVAIAAAAGGAEAGGTLDRVLQSKKLVNAVDAEYPPFSFRNANDQLEGFDIAVAQEVANRLGVTIEHVTPGWDVITAGNWAGRWDISIGSMAVTPARAAVLDFPASYYFVNAVILVPGDSTITGPADLAGKRVGVLVASTREKYLQRSLSIDALDALPVRYLIDSPEIVTYEEEPMGVDDLAAGAANRLDAMIVDQLSAESYIAYGRPLKIVGEPLFAEPVAVAVDKGDPEFAARIAEIIAAMRADGSLRKLSLERLGIDITALPGG